MHCNLDPEISGQKLSNNCVYCENCGNLLFAKNIVKSTKVTLLEIISKWNICSHSKKFRENIFGNEKSRFNEISAKKVACCTVWKSVKITATQIFFPSNQFIKKFFSETLIWRNFCQNNHCWRLNIFPFFSWKNPNPLK